LGQQQQTYVKAWTTRHGMNKLNIYYISCYPSNCVKASVETKWASQR